MLSESNAIFVFHFYMIIPSCSICTELKQKRFQSFFFLLFVTCFVLTEIKKTVDCCWVQMLETTQKYFVHLCECCSFDDD
ncbi:hypothetical protein ACE6H2_024291 [Prunus campanulata]